MGKDTEHRRMHESREADGMAYLGEALSGRREGAIERSEAAGQTEFVNSTQLPVECNWGTSDDELTAMGIELGEPTCPLFRDAILPPGWAKRATDHWMGKKKAKDDGLERSLAKKMFELHYGAQKMPIKSVNAKLGIPYRAAREGLWDNLELINTLFNETMGGALAAHQVQLRIYEELEKRFKNPDEVAAIKTIELAKMFVEMHKIAQKALEYERPPASAGGGTIEAKGATELQKILTDVLSKATDAEVSPRTPLEFDENAIDID